MYQELKWSYLAKPAIGWRQLLLYVPDDTENYLANMITNKRLKILYSWSSLETNIWFPERENLTSEIRKSVDSIYNKIDAYPGFYAERLNARSYICTCIRTCLSIISYTNLAVCEVKWWYLNLVNTELLSHPEMWLSIKIEVLPVDSNTSSTYKQWERKRLHGVGNQIYYYRLGVTLRSLMIYKKREVYSVVRILTMESKVLLSSANCIKINLLILQPSNTTGNVWRLLDTVQFE